MAEGEFETWLKKLDAYAERLGFMGKPLHEQTGEEAWRGYFDDGYSPSEALDEDMTYG